MTEERRTYRVIRRKAKGTHRPGQSAAEFALVLPLLIILFSVIVEAGLMLNSWNRVNTAARDATRFALDAGRPQAITDLIRYKLAGLDEPEMTVFIISGTTTITGSIPPPNWEVSRTWGTRLAAPLVSPQLVSDRLKQTNDPNAYNNIAFSIVEVNYQYTPLLTTLLASNARLPMSSYALVQINR